MKLRIDDNQSLNIKTEVYDNFELYIKILSHYNMGKERKKNVELILNEYRLSEFDWEEIVASWKDKIFDDPYLGLEMIPLLEKYNEYFALADQTKP